MRIPHLIFAAGLIALMILGTSCVSVKVVSVDRKTQLENQILGSIATLQDDLVLIASVRGEGETRADIPPAQREALMAMMNRQFNLDDLNSLRSLGIAGEKRDGLVAFIATERTNTDSNFKAFATRIIDEENHDRDVIMARIISTNPNLSEKDFPTVRRMMHKLAVEASPAGTLIESNQGWVKKLEPTP